MKAAIRQRALELGFDDCRFTSADAPASAKKFQSWIAEKKHGEMAWLERNAEKRIEPQRVLGGAKSVIVLAASYEQDASLQGMDHPAATVLQASPVTGHFPGVVARYARFDDYHDILGERLKSLTEFVNQLGGTGIQSLWYVDTGPLLERDLAQRAGLGFVGKHTNLINSSAGSWFFLGEILTDLPLPTDQPATLPCSSRATARISRPTR